MPKAGMSGFLLTAVPVGAIVSAAFIITLVYTMGVRGWGLDRREASVPAQLLGALWVVFIIGGGLFLSSRCAHAFGVEGTSRGAQIARLWFGLIWMGMSAISIFATVGIIAWKKEKRQKASAKRDRVRQ